MRSRNRMLITATAAAAVLVLAGCAPGTDDSTGPAPDANGAVTSTDYLAEAYEGVTAMPPTEPVTITPDISAWIVSCGEAVTTCSTPAAAAQEAAIEVGWEADICDGQLNPAVKSECIRNGIAAGADVMVIIGDECAQFSGALSEARDAGIVTIAAGGEDCDDTPLFSGVQQPMPNMSNEEWWGTLGALQAKWLIGQADGDVNVLNVEFNDTMWGPWMAEGRLAVFEDCDRCEIVGTVQLANSDIGAGTLVQKFETALLQNPTANSVAIPIDGWFLAGVGQAIEASGRSADVNFIGAMGSIPNFGLIRDGVGQDATVAMSGQWNGWGAIDTALRVLAGQEIQPSGYGLQAVDADTNLPEPGAEFAYAPEVDFRAEFRSAWGL